MANGPALNEQFEIFLRKSLDKIANERNYKKYELKLTEVFGKGENYLGEIKRVTLEGLKEDNEEETIKLVVKTPPPNLQNVMPMDKYYACEKFIYDVYVPLFNKLQDKANFTECAKLKFANCLLSSVEVGSEIFIFEDLNSKGYKMYNKMKSFDKDHTILLMKTLATFHALGFAVKETVTKEVYDNFKSLSAVKEELNDEFFHVVKEVANMFMDYVDCDISKEKLKTFIDGDLKTLMYDYLDLNKNYEDGKYNIIVHADGWSNNFLFKYEEGQVQDMIILDWQTIRYATPIVDLAIALYICLDEETRENLWDELLDTYYSVLSSRLVDLGCDPHKCYPEDVFRRQLKEKMGYVLVMSMVLLPFCLTNKDDSVDMYDLLDESDSFTMTNVKFSEECIRRMNGVIRHLIRTDIL